MMFRALLLGSLAFLASAAAACGSDAGSAAPAPACVTAIEPQAPCVFHRCDPHEEACQRHTLDAISCFKRVPAGKLPTIRFVPDRLEVEPTRDLPIVDVALAFSTRDAFRPEPVVAAGVVSFDGEIVLVERSGLDLQTVLAHELVHVLQRRTSCDWRGVTCCTLDQGLGDRLRIEGEADFFERFATEGVVEQEPGRAVPDLEAAFARLLDPNRQALHYLRSRFAYEAGRVLVEHAWRKGGPAAIAALHTRSPSAQELLFDVPPRSVTFSVPEPLANAELVHFDVLGAAGVYANAGRRGGAAAQLASAWRGDQLHVYRRGEEKAVRWMVRFDTPANADAFAALPPGDTGFPVEYGSAGTVAYASVATEPLRTEIVSSILALR